MKNRCKICYGIYLEGENYCRYCDTDAVNDPDNVRSWDDVEKRCEEMGNDTENCGKGDEIRSKSKNKRRK